MPNEEVSERVEVARRADLKRLKPEDVEGPVKMVFCKETGSMFTWSDRSKRWSEVLPL